MLTGALEEHFRRGGAVIFPPDPLAPVNVYRSTLYTPDELYTDLAHGFDATPDARAYHWSQDARLAHDHYVTLLRAIHDDAITDALDEALAGRRCVGVMGGHAMRRDSADYRAAARLGFELAQAGYLTLTGGGPGAMEAVALGAMARDEATLWTALQAIAEVPGFGDITTWARLGLDVRAAMPEPKELACVGIPTWFYGHEPPTPFAQLHAKYFSNAIREDVLLSRANAGLVYLPGAAGTVQELFQAVTPGYYSPTGGVPLVLVGREQWTTTVPVWPLLQSLSEGRPLATRLHLVPDDDPKAVLAALT